MPDQLPLPQTVPESDLQPLPHRGHGVGRAVLGVSLGVSTLAAATAVDVLPRAHDAAQVYEMPVEVTDFNLDSQIKIGEGVTVTASRIDPTIGNSITGAKGAAENPYLDSCDTAKAPIVASIHEKWDGMLEAGEAIKSSSSIEDMKIVLYGVSQKTGIPIYVLTENEAKPFPLDGYEIEDVEILREFALRFVYGLMYLPPEVVKAAEVNKFVLAETIMDKTGSEESPFAGYFLSSWKKGGDIVMDTSYESVVVHELMHALEAALCRISPEWEDKNLGSLNKHPYVGINEYSKTPGVLYQPNIDREFATAYGATDEGEDSAEMFVKIFYEEGLVQPGDPDYGSRYHFKQIYLMKRLDRMFPGTIDYAIAQSNELRKRHPKHPYIRDETGQSSEKRVTTASSQKAT